MSNYNFETNSIFFLNIFSQFWPSFISSYFSSSSNNFWISGVISNFKPDFSMASGNLAGDAVAMQILLTSSLLKKVKIISRYRNFDIRKVDLRPPYEWNKWNQSNFWENISLYNNVIFYTTTYYVCIEFHEFFSFKFFKSD